MSIAGARVEGRSEVTTAGLFATPGAAAEARLSFAAFSSKVCAHAGEPKGFGEIGVSIAIAGQTVRPGDWIVGDDDGVMVLPREQAVELANRAMDVLEKENRLRGEIDAGKTLAEVAYLQKWEKARWAQPLSALPLSPQPAAVAHLDDVGTLGDQAVAVAHDGQQRERLDDPVAEEAALRRHRAPGQAALARPRFFEVVAVHGADHVGGDGFVVVVRAGHDLVGHVQCPALEVGDRARGERPAFLLPEALKLEQLGLEEARAVLGEGQPQRSSPIRGSSISMTRLGYPRNSRPITTGGNLFSQMTSERSPSTWATSPSYLAATLTLTRL